MFENARALFGDLHSRVGSAQAAETTQTTRPESQGLKFDFNEIQAAPSFTGVQDKSVQTAGGQSEAEGETQEQIQGQIQEPGQDQTRRQTLSPLQGKEVTDEHQTGHAPQKARIRRVPPLPGPEFPELSDIRFQFIDSASQETLRHYAESIRDGESRRLPSGEFWAGLHEFVQTGRRYDDDFEGDELLIEYVAACLRGKLERDGSTWGLTILLP